MIAIIDYGMGNLKSVKNALDFLGIESIITKDKEVIRKVKAIILPGVGAFGQAMDNLKKENLDIVIKDLASEGKIILGICLGMQILFEEGFEGEKSKGLGLIKGNIRKIQPKEKVKIPHMGWNNIVINKKDDITSGISGDNFLYYVHSFMACEYMEENLIGYSNYGGIRIPGIVKRGNIIGMQFHPEKSGEIGLRLLKNFGEMIK